MRRNPTQTSDLESDILKRVRAGDGISRIDLARELGLAPSTAGIYVERLIAGGFIAERESETAQRGSGRPPVLLKTDPDGGEFIGVDFEARNIMAVAVDFSDKPLRNSHKLIGEGDSVKQIVGKIEEAVREVLPRDPARLLAIGVGVPGVVDSSRGIAVHYKYIPRWDNIPLAAMLAKRFPVPVFLENNARSMALSELWFGQGKGHDDFLCIGIRSGIGVGLVLEGHLYCGAHHAAGELGRWRCPTVSAAAAPWFGGAAGGDPDGPELQEIASVLALQKALHSAIGKGQKTVLSGRRALPSLSDIVNSSQQRDALTVRVVGEAAGALGWAIGHLSLAVDPAKVVLAGPLTALGDTFLQPIRERVERILKPASLRAPEIVNSTMGEFSGALGAAALALHEWKPPGVKAGKTAKAAAKRTR